MSFRNKHSASSLPTILPWIFAVIVIALTCLTLWHIDKMMFNEPGANPQEYVNASGLKTCLDSVPSGTPVTADIVKGCLKSEKSTAEVLAEVVKPRIEELKWLLTIIAALAGFLAVAQSAAAWFSADTYTKRADAGLENINNLLAAIRIKYPLFESIEEKRTEALADLDRMFAELSKIPDASAGSTEALDWEDNLFRKLGVAARQNLLSVESFASIDLEPKLAPDDHAELLRKLALFYRSKFEYDKGVGMGTFGDLERAEAYLVLANAKKRDFTIKNDLASVYGTIYRVMRSHKQLDAQQYLAQSEKAFTESLEMEPHQLRAHHGLAVIAGMHRKKYEEAIAEQELTLDSNIPWQRGHSAYMQSIIFYNMACYKSRLLQKNMDLVKPITASQGREVVSFLRRAANVSYVRKDLIKEDFTTPEGDIIGLLKRADNDLRAQLEGVRAELEQKASQLETAGKQGKAPGAKLSLWQALSEALKLIGISLKKSS